MAGGKAVSHELGESIDLQHWTDALGSPLLIFIFVLIAAHLVAFVFWIIKVMSAQPEGRQMRPGLKKD
jgi:hypothetical protein